MVHKIIPRAISHLSVQTAWKQTVTLEWNRIAKRSFINKYKTCKEINMNQLLLERLHNTKYA